MFRRLSMRVEMGGFASDVCFALLILIIVLGIVWLRTRHRWLLLCCAVFGVYLLYLIDQVFFPLHISGGFADAQRELPFWSNVNLIPFSLGRSGSLQRALPGFLLNVLLTIPFGFGINFLRHIKPRTFVWLALAVGVVLEGAQLLISVALGYTYRQIDVNDVIMNAVGVWLGYAAFRVFTWLYVAATGRCALRQRGLAAYIYAVAQRATPAK